LVSLHISNKKKEFGNNTKPPFIVAGA